MSWLPTDLPLSACCEYKLQTLTWISNNYYAWYKYLIIYMVVQEDTCSATCKLCYYICAAVFPTLQYSTSPILKYHNMWKQHSNICSVKLFPLHAPFSFPRHYLHLANVRIGNACPWWLTSSLSSEKNGIECLKRYCWMKLQMLHKMGTGQHSQRHPSSAFQLTFCFRGSLTKLLLLCHFHTTTN